MYFYLARSLPRAHSGSGSTSSCHVSLFRELGTAQGTAKENAVQVHRKRFLKSSNSSLHLPLHDSYIYIYIIISHLASVPHLVALGLILNRIRLLMFLQVCWLVHDVFRPRHHDRLRIFKRWHGATRHPCASGINGMVPRSGRPLS